jgi:hypothetical protein
VPLVATYLGQAIGWYQAGEGAGLIGAGAANEVLGLVSAGAVSFGEMELMFGLLAA